jgi:hypothetical protein
MKIVFLAAMTLVLSACGVPTAVVVLGAADGATFMSSGKSITSHTMTAVTRKDCSVLFGITRGQFCKEKEDLYENPLADSGSAEPKDRQAVTKSSDPVALLEPRYLTSDQERPSASRDASEPHWTLVLGTFPDRGSAVELARQMKPGPGLVTSFVVKGEVRYRVSTPPLKGGEAVGRQLNIARLDLDNVELMRVCPDRTQNDDCVALHRSLAIQQADLR